MKIRTIYRFIHRLLSILLLSLFCLYLSGNNVLSARALTQHTTAQEPITIHTGNYQIPADLLTILKTELGQVSEVSGGATVFGVGYYEEHSSWAWINLLAANGRDFD